MTTQQRIQLSRRKGFDLQAASRSLNGLPAVNCARPSQWGNPFRVVHLLDGGEQVWIVKDPRPTRHSTRYGTKGLAVRAAVEKYRGWLRTPDAHETLTAARIDLRGANLACWCKPGDPCHCDVLLEIANAEEP